MPVSVLPGTFGSFSLNACVADTGLGVESAATSSRTKNSALAATKPAAADLKWIAALLDEDIRPPWGCRREPTGRLACHRREIIGWLSMLPQPASESRAIREIHMSFALYMFGLAVLVGGMAWGLVVAGLQQTYVIIACLIVAGIGIMMAVSRTRAKDPPA